MLCLHTAGADGRQYRGLLNDPEVTANYRVIVFDMPRHGKSSPPPGFVSDMYVLTTEEYISMTMTMAQALKLENPVIIGCSIGGRAVLHLAQRHPQELRAVIGLQSALYADAGGELSGEKAEPLFRPDVNGQELSAASVASITAPQANPADRWETLWHYMQGGPGVFLGDLYYYFVDGDLRHGKADDIDRKQCPIYLLTGEYDLSATPEMTAELAKQVEATYFKVMKHLGHFPMSEDYAKFRTHLLPVLDRIMEDTAA
ncbi:MAG: alpha/beta hydrolase [Pseudomonadota bacterium]